MVHTTDSNSHKNADKSSRKNLGHSFWVYLNSDVRSETGPNQGGCKRTCIENTEEYTYGFSKHLLYRSDKIIKDIQRVQCK